MTTYSGNFASSTVSGIVVGTNPYKLNASVAQSNIANTTEIILELDNSEALAYSVGQDIVVAYDYY